MKHKGHIDVAAARWLVRRDLGWNSTATADRGAFERWLAHDARHRAAYLRLETAWRQADRLSGMRPPGGAIDPDLFARRGFLRPPLRARLAWGACAATVLLASFAAWWWISWSTQWQSYTTEVGGYERVWLADNTSVELNTDTHLQVRLSGDHRRVRLLRGEALFNVARDARRPFDVFAAGMTIRAVGTAFNVRMRDSQKVEVVVTEGRVALSNADLPRDLSAATRFAPTLSAGERAVSEPDGMVVQEVAVLELQRRLAWQNGELIFQGDALADAVNEFNRYNRRQLEIADAGLGSLRIGGNFQATDVFSFVKALQQSFSIRVEVSSDGARYVLRRSRSDSADDVTGRNSGA